MRPIGHLPDADQARRFADFCAAEGMATDLDREADGRVLVWIVEEDHFERSKALLAEFAAMPNAPRFLGHDGRAERQAKAEAEEQAAYARRIRTRKSLVARTTAHGVGPVTFTVISLCIAVAVYSYLGTREALTDQLVIENPNVGGFLGAVRQGEVWRVLSPIFLHFGLAHIVFNMMWLYRLGSMVEARCGSLWVIGFIVGTGLLSNLAQRGVGSVYFGGMSGVVYALVGYTWIRGKLDPGSGVMLDPVSRNISLIWLVVCMTGLVGPIANTAHFSGLVLGMVWAWIDSLGSVQRRER